ncbi:uncharacterized protein LOC131602060 isoform X2 [Vicia villosa]|uniref:uncharacterized protein LOC131602060 isoform X2 n=1 Tax=Vicia villosa TaxID=3911 RepID=UPI00273B45F1|nr:uncharacterized protein LOC131602060 isoform X2 [Vicia villosa]
MRGKAARRNNGRVVEPVAPSVESDFVESIKAVTEFPRSSFEFYVWSDQGVNLEVDFTSSLSDWTSKFKNEVRVSDNVNGNKSRSLRQDLSGLSDKSSFLWNTDCSQVVDCDGQGKSSSSGLKLTKDGVADSVAVLGKQNNGERMTVKVGKNLLENHSKPLMSDPGTLEVQLSKPDNGGSVNCGLPKGSCIVSPGVVCAGGSLSISVELHDSELASCHKYAPVLPCDGHVSPDLSYPKNTPEKKHFRAAKTVDGKGRSRCSQFDDPLKKSRLDYDDQVSKTELHKKRKDRYSKIQGSSGKPAARILRSTTKTAVMTLPRRSPRIK